MKQIFTLVALMASMSLFAQNVNQTFETQADFNALTSNCWTVTNFTHNTTSPLGGSAGDIRSNLNTTSTLTTPLMNLPNNFTISFDFSIIQNGTGADKIVVLVGEGAGAKSYKPQLNGTSVNVTVNGQSGVKRITIQINNTLIQLDNLSITAPYLYTGGCQAAPTVADDIFNTTVYAPFSADFRTNDGAEPAGQTSTYAITTPSPDGTVVINADGTFTFTPAVGFTGLSATFTYSRTISGYYPATATVTINYPAPAQTLPVKLVSFGGTLNNGKVNLRWSVEENETGKYFQVQKSADGRNFTNAGMMFNSSKSGSENYQYEETMPYADAAYYRIMVVNKDNSITYSKVIALKGQAAQLQNKLTVMQNPVKGNTLQVCFTSDLEEPTTFSLYNMSGAQVYTQNVTAQKGLNTVSLTISRELSAGAYILESRSTTQRNITRIIK